MAIPVIQLFFVLAMGVMQGSCAVGVVRLSDPEPSPSGPSPSTAPAQSAAVSAPATPARSPSPPAPPPPEPEPPAPKTVEEIRGECWMKADANRSIRDIDARLKFVQNCVDERVRGDSRPAGAERTRRR